MVWRLRTIGADPGTGSFDIVAMEDDRVVKELVIEPKKASPDMVVLELEHYKTYDLMVVTCGLGFPVTKVQSLTEEDIKEITLRPIEDEGRMLRRLVRSDLPAVTLPSVKLLPTVPEWRKINRIDMGTPDKVSAAALAIKNQAERLKVNYSDVSFIFLEVGRGFTTVLPILNGQIIDGLGGTNGPMGLTAPGAIDGEVVRMLEKIPTRTVYLGGVASILGVSDLTVSELLDLAMESSKAKLALKRFIEDISRTVTYMSSEFDADPRIILSGGGSRDPRFIEYLGKNIERENGIMVAQRSCVSAKEGAEGAAVIANGLSGGEYAELVETMKLRAASGRVRDHIYIANYAT